jgi:hypothetical protein
MVGYVMRSYSKAFGGALTNASPVYAGLRFAAGPVNVRIEIWKPITRKCFLTAIHAPRYVGGDGIKSSGEQLGLLSGTVANGNVLTFRPGAWAGGGLTFKGIRIYLNGSDTIGSGTLLQTNADGTWTWTASGLTPGANQQLYIELDVVNSFGTTTVRSGPIAGP